MKRFCTLFFACFISIYSFGQTTLAAWTFEGVTTSTASGTTLSITTGSAVADAGVLTTGTAVTATHVSASTVYSTPSGNGSVKALSSNNWAVGDYYQFKVSTLGYSGIKVSVDHTGSNTGPAPFKIQYSTTAGGTSGYTDAVSYTIPNRLPSATGAVTWSSTTPITPDSTTFRADLSSNSSVNNLSELYFRVVCTATTAIGSTSTFGSGGTSRIDNFTVTAQAAIPVELMDFKVRRQNQTTKLDWQTASELNNNYYDIERSADGKTFEKIGDVSGYGNSSQMRSYSFVDEKPNSGVNYYRLRQVDFDGTTSFSKTVSVDFNKNLDVKVYPNVVKEQLAVEINGDGGAADLSIVNMLGQVVKQQNVKNTEGVISLTINDLPNGQYLVRVVTKAGQMTQRFEKQ